MKRVMPHGLRRAYLSTPRTPANDRELHDWLENMMIDHRYSIEEASITTGLAKDQIQAAMARIGIDGNQPIRQPGSKLRMLPYPGGGRHPLIGCLEAINPQRETKVSVFTPWDPESYVVADLPEAIWSNLGLTYLAHIDVQTVWEQRGIPLERMEWTRHRDGLRSAWNANCPTGFVLEPRRLLRQRLYTWRCGSRMVPIGHLRTCTCKTALCSRARPAFSGKRAITGSSPSPILPLPCEPTSDRVGDPRHGNAASILWSNGLCPCIHSDPKFPDTAPGETQRLKGWLSFYQGRDIEGEMKRIDNLGWRTV